MTSHRLNDMDEVASIGTSSADLPKDRQDPSTIPIVRYIEQYGGRLQGRRSYARHLMCDVREGQDVCVGRLQDMQVGA